MRAPSPAFSLYPKDIESDERCKAMTHAEFGMYMRLLLNCWTEGSIPAEPVKLQRLLKVSSKTFKATWPAIEPCFTPSGDRLTQSRLEEERTRQRERSLINSDRGRKGGRPKESTTDIKPRLSLGKSEEKPDESLSFPSPSSSPSNPEPPPAPACEERASALMAALRKAREVTGEDGATVLAQGMVRGKGAPIMNPAVCPEAAQELWRITTERVYGYIAAWEADRKAKPKRKAGSPSWDRPAPERETMASAIAWVDQHWPASWRPKDRLELDAKIAELAPPAELSADVLTHLIFAHYPDMKGVLSLSPDALAKLRAEATLAPKNPPPETLPKPTATVTVIPNHCPECDGVLSGEHRGENYILRCGDEHGLGCEWAAVARKVAA